MFAAFFLGLSLAMDCFAIAIAQGVRHTGKKSLLILASLFGLFQGGMLLLGYLASHLLQRFLGSWMALIAALLLFWIGGKMLVESFASTDNEDVALIAWQDYLVLSLATSIDALAAGISLETLHIPILWATFWVGLTSFALGGIGGFFGSRLGLLLGKRAELLGGLVLIGLGVKAL